MNHVDKESGFTILELMAAIGIIGVLTAIAVPMYLNWHKSTHDVETQKDVLSLSQFAARQINGAGTIKSIDNVEQTGYQFVSEGVVLSIKADRSGICVTGYNPEGKRHTRPSNALTAFDGRVGVECPDKLQP